MSAPVRTARKAGQAVLDWLAEFESMKKANKLWAVAKVDKEAEALVLEAK